MKVLKLKKNERSQVVKEAVRVLSDGGLLIYPTETAYGAGVDATNQKAVDRLLRFKSRPVRFKSRPEGRPLSVAVCDQNMASQYAKLNQTALSIYQNFLPGPVTVVSLGRHKVAQGVESERGTLGIRIPDYSLILEIIRVFGRPITATSANLSGQKTPYSVDDILNNLSEKRRNLIDLIIDAGKLPKRPTSTVVDTTMEDFQIIRQGQVQIPKLIESRKHKEERQVISNSEEETQKIAKDILLEHISVLKHNCLVFALIGDLGSGKTQFAKGLARGLHITEPVTSPTFNLIAEHKFSLPFSSSPSTFYHLDTWRLFDPKELDNLDLEKIFQSGNVVAIEWAEKIATDDFKPTTCNYQLIQVKFDHISQKQRLLTISLLPSLSSVSS